MKYYSIGYAVNDGLPEVTREDVQKLTHMNLAFGLISENGLLDLHQMTHLDLIPQFRDWNPALRVVLSVGGWGAGGFSLMSRTEEGRRAFAESCRKAVEEYHLDGIDIDWEYPCSDQAEIDCDSSDKQNYTKLLQALRDALGMNRIVSTAVGAGDYFPENTEMDKVAEIVDYVQLMTYDM
ncbi:MAG TPA: chitinase, partial [Ruminococcaceae bacterium]|nr:chitinase [Oscillospiraceae bacterium]